MVRLLDMIARREGVAISSPRALAERLRRSGVGPSDLAVEVEKGLEL